MLRIFTFMMICLTLSCGSDEGTEGAETGAACAEGNAIALCPTNTRALLEADAESSCNTEGSIDVDYDMTMSTQAMGAVSQVCAGSGSCRVVCELLEACDYGVRSVSVEEGIICQSAPCGNGICDSGENPENCAVDCAEASCEPNDRRCMGDTIQECNQQGLWETAACGSGQVCREMVDMAMCVDPQSVCGNGACEVGEDPMSCPQDCTSTACGDGVCEAGEAADTCPNDCDSTVCVDGATRCSSGSLQRCNQRGEWETTPCEMGQLCAEDLEGARCEATIDCRSACASLLTCVEGAEICIELDVEQYDAHCFDRCDRYPGRFLDYLESPEDCRRALSLNLIRDEASDQITFCNNPLCDQSCDSLWTNCADPLRVDGLQCGAPEAMSYQPWTERAFLAACDDLCEDPTRTVRYEAYLEELERGTPRLCKRSYDLGLFECSPPECGNGACEYTERTSPCEDCRE